MSNLKIDEILKNNENYIGTYSKDNVSVLKNNQSTIINLQDSDKNGSHWASYKKIDNKIFYFDSYAIAYIPDIIKNQYPNHNLFATFIGYNQLILINVVDFVSYSLNLI